MTSPVSSRPSDSRLDPVSALLAAARVVAAAGLSDAFGHVSVRLPDRTMLITGPVPLDRQTPDTLARIGPGAAELPPGAPKEAWIHLALVAADPATGAICRAHPRAVAKATAAGIPLRALDGHGALLGPVVPVHPNSRLVRDPSAASAVVSSAGSAAAVVLHGNGAVTRASDLAGAVALMWLLERSAELNLAAPDGAALPDDEQAWWRDRGAELLPRIYDYLVEAHPSHCADRSGFGGTDPTRRENVR